MDGLAKNKRLPAKLIKARGLIDTISEAKLGLTISSAAHKLICLALAINADVDDDEMSRGVEDCSAERRLQYRADIGTAMKLLQRLNSGGAGSYLISAREAGIVNHALQGGIVQEMEWSDGLLEEIEALEALSNKDSDSAYFQQQEACKLIASTKEDDDDIYIEKQLLIGRLLGYAG